VIADSGRSPSRWTSARPAGAVDERLPSGDHRGLGVACDVGGRLAPCPVVVCLVYMSALGRRSRGRLYCLYGPLRKKKKSKTVRRSSLRPLPLWIDLSWRPARNCAELCRRGRSRASAELCDRRIRRANRLTQPRHAGRMTQYPFLCRCSLVFVVGLSPPATRRPARWQRGIASPRVSCLRLRQRFHGRE